MAAVPRELQLSQLGLLPAQFRAPAKEAASGSRKALSRIASFIASCRDPVTTRLFLPVVYAVLQSAQIPTTDELDTAGTAKTLGQVYTAILILKAIRPPLPTHIILHIWPLLWKRIHLIFLHPSCLPHPAPTEDTLCSDLVHVVLFLYLENATNTSAAVALAAADPAVCAVIEATPGVQILVSRAMVNALRRGDAPGMYFSTVFVAFNSDIQLGEWVEGAGGTHSHLAVFIVKLLDFLVADPGHAEVLYKVPIALIEKSRYDKHLLLALLNCGVVGALTRMVHAFLTHPFDFPVEGDFIWTLCMLHTVCTSTPLVEKCIIEALQARLLPALLTTYKRGVIKKKESPYTVKLFSALAASLVQYSVVVEMEIYMPDVLDMMVALLAKGWKAKPTGHSDAGFFFMLTDRCQVRSAYDAGKAGSLQACDNMKCGVILGKSQLRRCSQCCQRSYCSTDCQMVDWREEGHRKICKSLKSQAPPGTPVDRGFMRAILDKEFKEGMRPGLWRRQVMFMYQNPDTDLYCVFDYSAPPKLAFAVFPLKDLPCSNPLWADAAARAGRSGGRMQIHLLRVLDGSPHRNIANGSNGRERLFALRSSLPDVQDGLRALARSLPAGVANVETLSKEIEQGVAELMIATEDVVQIHCE
ncbi:hypothetical protein C8R46DRAFT_374063 [Mycena filopes]|nr:hypothetical protein C8R46DRAFT_374063 [Mycena filopes]